jgi:uncharacterized membrane protein (Fun14 family)
MELPPKYPIIKEPSFLEALVSNPNAPWRAKSVLLALMVVIASGGLWIRGALKRQFTAPQQNTTATAATHTPASSFNQPLPLTFRAGLSYIGGFFIGWTFRRFVRLAVVLSAIVILLLGLSKYAGCDTATTKAKIKERSILLRGEAKAARDYLKHLLPSASAAAVGSFLGFRRKDSVRLSRQ